MGEITARLRDGIAALEREGDLFLVRAADGAITGLWMVTPRTGSRGRIAAKGHGREDEPEWEITVEDDRVTVSPSIDEGGGGYHGHLRNGVWANA